MREPKIIQENEMQKGVIYHYWPDGTPREIPYKDFTERNIGKCRVFYERLAFIFIRIIRLVRHFDFIDVRKETDCMGHRKYVARWEPKRKIEPVDIPVNSGNIRTGCSFRNRPGETKNGAKSR